MSQKKQLHLAAFMRPVAIHTGSWRYPDAAADANFNFPLLRSLAQALGADGLVQVDEKLRAKESPLLGILRSSQHRPSDLC